MEQTVYEKISLINDQLRSLGKKAIQEIKMTNREGKVIGQVKYGYRPQYVFDCVNQFLGPENWKYELTKEEIFENQAVAEVKLFIKVNDEWLCKGSQKGQMQIIKGNVGDAQKGSITDAIQKCFSLLSIGSDAYKGLLKNVYKANNPKRTAKPAPKNSPKSTPKPNLTALPKIAGVSFDKRDGVIVALGERLYDKRELLKAAGFQWDGKQKTWLKQAA